MFDDTLVFELQCEDCGAAWAATGYEECGTTYLDNYSQCPQCGGTQTHIVGLAEEN